MIAEVVYLLCAVASIGCAALLFRSYRRNPVRLLLWTMISFLFLSVNNVMLVVDRVLVPDINFSLVRAGAALAAGVVLLYGLIWDGK